MYECYSFSYIFHIYVFIHTNDNAKAFVIKFKDYLVDAPVSVGDGFSFAGGISMEISSLFICCTYYFSIFQNSVIV